MIAYPLKQCKLLGLIPWPCILIAVRGCRNQCMHSWLIIPMKCCSSPTFWGVGICIIVLVLLGVLTIGFHFYLLCAQNLSCVLDTSHLLLFSVMPGASTHFNTAFNHSSCTLIFTINYNILSFIDRERLLN